MLATGLNTAPIYIIEEKSKQIKTNIEQKLHYMSNLKNASKDLQFDVDLVNRILRPMMKKSAQ